MKTVKKGRKQGGWAQKFKCTGKGNGGGGCGARLLVSQTDIYQTRDPAYGDITPDYLLTFCCPECGVETNVDGVSVDPLGKRPSEKERKAVARNKKTTGCSRGKIKITLGSTSPYKLNAVRKACERLGMKASVSGVKTSSGQNKQPVGFEETFNGALTRARLAMAMRDVDAVSIGIENGIFRFNAEIPISIDLAVIVLITSGMSDIRRIVTTSAGIVFPEDCVEIAESRGFESTTVGSVIAEKFGGDSADPHSVLTNGRVSRAMILTDALVTAFGQI